ncbi:MAG: hypothetical protein KME21_19055 [Desmonostoc vinosum HA7617-LM4]|jgi:hypothetical protein|nr:hypothetical protein [Desmonostoc vinosum HA7617-LM4]
MKSHLKPYTQPKLTVFGDVQVLTQGLKDGSALDKDFPTGTPKGKLTFSDTY